MRFFARFPSMIHVVFLMVLFGACCPKGPLPDIPDVLNLPQDPGYYAQGQDLGERIVDETVQGFLSSDFIHRFLGPWAENASMVGPEKVFWG
ncbi:MAG: hypothetical protein EOM25_06115, partial [Deltaproteobacteria bacterium]|nr:hypothetical protein [Deltaproteobacteria bacterium]